MDNIEYKRIKRCDNCKYNLRAYKMEEKIYCDCKKFNYSLPIQFIQLRACKYYKPNKKNINN